MVPGATAFTRMRSSRSSFANAPELSGGPVNRRVAAVRRGEAPRHGADGEAFSREFLRPVGQRGRVDVRDDQLRARSTEPSSDRMPDLTPATDTRDERDL